MERIFPTVNQGEAHFDNSLKLGTRLCFVQMWRVFWLSLALKITTHLSRDCSSIHQNEVRSVFYSTIEIF